MGGACGTNREAKKSIQNFWEEPSKEESRDSLVGIELGYGLDERGSRV
jgi:hypothetical protein